MYRPIVAKIDIATLRNIALMKETERSTAVALCSNLLHTFDLEEHRSKSAQPKKIQKPRKPGMQTGGGGNAPSCKE